MGCKMGLSENRLKPYTQWFCWSLSLLNGYFIGGIPHFQTYPYVSIQFHCLSACFVLLLHFFCLPQPMWKSSKPMGRAALSAVHEQDICFQGGCGCGAVPPLFVGGIVAHPALQSVRCWAATRSSDCWKEKIKLIDFVGRSTDSIGAQYLADVGFCLCFLLNWFLWHRFFKGVSWRRKYMTCTFDTLFHTRFSTFRCSLSDAIVTSLRLCCHSGYPRVLRRGPCSREWNSRDQMFLAAWQRGPPATHGHAGHDGNSTRWKTTIYRTSSKRHL